MDRTDESATNRPIHDIANIYRLRFDAMFAVPDIGQHIRRPFRHTARFRWTSFEISEARSKGTIPLIQQWLNATVQVRTCSNSKTMLIHCDVVSDTESPQIQRQMSQDRMPEWHLFTEWLAGQVLALMD